MLNVRRVPSHANSQLFTPHKPEIAGDGSQRKIVATVNTSRLDAYNSRILPEGLELADGDVLSLLLHHDVTHPIGRVETIQRSRDAIRIEATITDEAVWPLIYNGSIAGTSIGFRPLAWEQAEDDSFICPRWTLHEVSLTPVPANQDARVEQVRSLSPDYVRDLASQLAEEVFRMPPYPAPQRPDPGPGGPRIVGTVPLASPAVHARRAQRYDVARVLRTMVDGQRLDGMEGEIATELEQRAGPAPTRGIRIPSALFKRAVSTDPASIGALSPSQYVSALLDDMSQARRWAPLLQRIGFVQFNTTRETVIIPKRNRSIVASWGPKDTEAAESDWTAIDDTVTPKYVKAWVPIERSALRYADPSALMMTLADLGDSIDSEADTGLLFGTGANDQPTGLLFAPGRVLDKAGASATTEDFFDLKNTLMETWKKDTPDGLRWIMNSRNWDALRVTSKKQVVGTGEEWMSGIAPFDATEGVLLEIGVIQSGKVRVLSAPNTYNIYIVYGAMGVVVWFGGGSIDTIVDTSTLSTRAAVRVSGFLDCHCTVRDPHMMHAMLNVLAAPPGAGVSPLGPTPRTPPQTPPQQPAAAAAAQPAARSGATLHR
jgi:HK97 family phage prohead protease